MQAAWYLRIFYTEYLSRFLNIPLSVVGSGGPGGGGEESFHTIDILIQDWVGSKSSGNDIDDPGISTSEN